MKKCPACHSTYTDETLLYCLQDGVPLESTETESDEAETVVRHNIPEAVTVAIESEPATEEATVAAVTNANVATTPAPKTLIAILATVLVMLILFGVIAVAGFIYFNRGTPAEVISSKPDNNSSNEGVIGDANANTVSSPTPKSTGTATPIPTVEQTPKTPPTPKPTMTAAPGDISKQVSGRVYRWVSLAEARKLGPYMDHYGSRVDYYRKSGASKSFVRNDKSRAFRKYSTIRIEISGMKVTPSRDGKTASAVFDKQWLFANSQTRQTGKVRSRLIFRKVGSDWKIVSERDLKVYYVNK